MSIFKKLFGDPMTKEERDADKFRFKLANETGKAVYEANKGKSEAEIMLAAQQAVQEFAEKGGYVTSSSKHAEAMRAKGLTVTAVEGKSNEWYVAPK